SSNAPTVVSICASAMRMSAAKHNASAVGPPRGSDLRRPGAGELSPSDREPGQRAPERLDQREPEQLPVQDPLHEQAEEQGQVLALEQQGGRRQRQVQREEQRSEERRVGKEC